MTSAQQRQSPKSKKGQSPVDRLTPLKDSSDDDVMSGGDCNDDFVKSLSRSWRIAALGIAMLTGLIALLGIGIGSHAATPATGIAADIPYSGQYKHHDLFSAMYDPSDPPYDVDGSVQRISASFTTATANPGSQVPVNGITLPFKDETLITPQAQAGGQPSGSLPATSVVVGSIASFPPNMRASITSPPEYVGWVTIADLDSFYNHLDKHPDPQGCPPANTPNNAEYIAIQSELPVTSGASARSQVVGSLNRNDVVYISEVRFVASEQKLRGKSSTGWVTIQNQKSCEDKMTALPPAPTRGLYAGAVAPGGRKASFIVIGDWGWDPKIHWTVKNRQCQEHIALQMLQKFRELGDVQFIINVGDSFYPGGVYSAEDPQWQSKWRDVYHQELRDVPWYTVYGNHDMHSDPCTCNPDPNSCAQVNADPNDRTKFYMPSPNYYVEHPDIGVEVVALDTNRAGDPAVCHFTACPAQCQPILEARLQEANNLFTQRIQQSQAQSLIIFSHYPTDYLKGTQFLTGMMNDRRHNIAYFGGHRHSTDQNTAPIPPHQNWLVGGGGGLGCDGPQGFVVGEINSDNTIRTYSVMVPQGICCR